MATDRSLRNGMTVFFFFFFFFFFFPFATRMKRRRFWSEQSARWHRLAIHRSAKWWPILRRSHARCGIGTRLAVTGRRTL
mmetsp:Transcript_14012/g.11282  ORF Transcript_14012/g.11282 Transcript_14012/m.11282 type:complete len:80 (-) Transcript_14012:28-267(-)